MIGSDSSIGSELTRSSPNSRYQLTLGSLENLEICVIADEEAEVVYMDIETVRFDDFLGLIEVEGRSYENASVYDAGSIRQMETYGWH